MTLSRIFASSLIAAAVPLFADNGRQHAAGAPATTVTLRGVVSDAAGTPIVGAYVCNGVSCSGPTRHNGTKADGVYSITVPAGRPTVLTVEDFAFEPVTVIMTPTVNATVDFTLTKPRPAVTVTLINGETHVLDVGTSKFAYYRVFADYAKFNNANLCKTDGSSFAPHKSEIGKIVGPFTLANFSPCCSYGPVVTASIEMKSGETMQVYFNDSCFGGEIDFLGRERSTGIWYYFKFDDIAEMNFE